MKTSYFRADVQRPFMVWIIAGLLLAGLTVQGAAVTRYVDPDAPNPTYPYTSWNTAGTDLAEVVAVANANNAGDIVLVAANTYYLTNQIVVGNTVVSNAASDRALTIIDGNFPAFTNRCFYLTHAKSLVTGFTIRNGYTDGNDLLGMGAGIYMEAGTVRDCTIEGNYANYVVDNYRGGGGVYMIGNYLLDCTIRANTAHGISEAHRGPFHGGGGVYANGGLISNCWIHANTGTTACAGGVFLKYTTLRDSVVSSNYSSTANAGYGGGGIATFRAYTIENVAISGNSSQYQGGGIYISDAAASGAALKMRNCLIVGNTAGGNGGGIYGNYSLGNSQESIANCTIASNAAVLGGGIYFRANSTTSIVNTIVYHNRSSGDIDQNLYDLVASNNVHAILQSCIEPSTADFVIPNAVVGPPQFINPRVGNWHLRGDSPCIDAGSNRAWMTTDLDNDPRIRYGTVDLGAYEYESLGTLLEVH